MVPKFGTPKSRTITIYKLYIFPIIVHFHKNSSQSQYLRIEHHDNIPLLRINRADFHAFDNIFRFIERQSRYNAYFQIICSLSIFYNARICSLALKTRSDQSNTICTWFRFTCDEAENFIE